MEKFSEAEKYYQRLLTELPDNNLRDKAECYYALGSIALEKDDYNLSSEWHQKSLEIKRKSFIFCFHCVYDLTLKGIYLTMSVVVFMNLNKQKLNYVQIQISSFKISCSLCFSLDVYIDQKNSKKNIILLVF
jgi:tetratricopeptide (TPR) repeat protein